mmetsp:Transcript_51140/g.81467  ORF Transcript_51140/g.81467 Transcript_51140/m.81467 type:complete len:256 (-) Transcript_51140:752-1519(-)
MSAVPLISFVFLIDMFVDFRCFVSQSIVNITTSVTVSLSAPRSIRSPPSLIRMRPRSRPLSTPRTTSTMMTMSGTRACIPPVITISIRIFHVFSLFLVFPSMRSLVPRGMHTLVAILHLVHLSLSTLISVVSEIVSIVSVLVMVRFIRICVYMSRKIVVVLLSIAFERGIIIRRIARWRVVIQSLFLQHLAVFLELLVVLKRSLLHLLRRPEYPQTLNIFLEPETHRFFFFHLAVVLNLAFFIRFVFSICTSNGI